MQLDHGPGGRLSIGPHWDGVLGFRAFIAILGSLAMTYAVPARSQTAGSPPPGNGAGSIVAPTVRVTAPKIVTPVPGVIIQREQMSSNVQSASGKDIDQSRAVSLTDFMNGSLQSINVSDYRGNPYQQDLNFRGFTASPSIGTPQGVSVYLDGVRVNEPFGEVVNWDLIPMNALKRAEILPGSNPLFGHNTLGGALSLTTKDGFSDPGADLRMLGGSFGRSQIQGSVGGNAKGVAGFVAFNVFDENGWRQRSPSSVRQIFAKGGWRGEAGELGVSFLTADNELAGNGLVPLEMYRQQRDAVFTSPDLVENRLTHGTINGSWNIADTLTASLQGYQRDFRQRSTGGDFYDEWPAAAGSFRIRGCPPPFRTASRFSDGAGEVDAPGCPGVIPNGVFNYGRSDQMGRGLTAQLVGQRDDTQIVVGVSHDTSEIDFGQSQRLGWIADDRSVVLDPSDSRRTGLVPLSQAIQRNDLRGTSETTSLFGLSVWQVTPKLTLTTGFRYNRSRVKTNLVADRPIPLYQFTTDIVDAFLPECGAENDLASPARFICTRGDYGYRSFNPSAGLSWQADPTLTAFGNVSRGARVPSVIELGCARDRVAEAQFAGLNSGRLLGCSVPTGLTNDPFLPQVRSTTYEFGLRGQWSEGTWLWNATAFRTDLSDDILFVSLGRRNRGVFDTFGSTRRQGVEFGVSGAWGRHTLRVSYTYLAATFESSARVVNESNSESIRERGRVNEFEVLPGDRIPGIPANTLKVGWTVDMSDRWSFGANVIAQSFLYSRGNENNEHQPVGTDSDGRAVRARYDPTITTAPGRAFIGSGRIPGFAVLNLNATYRVDRDWSFFARLDNVFDTGYATAGELALNPFTGGRWGMRDAAGFNYNSNDWTHSQFIGPGTPRAMWVGVTYAYRPQGGS